MGNADSTFERELRSWKYEHDSIDPCFGQIRVYSKGGEQMCITSLVSSKITSFNHPNILKVHYQKIQKQQEYCSQFNLLTLAFEYVTNNLMKNMALRKDQSKGYLEPQLWAIIQQTSSALSRLLEHGINHLDLTPSNILLDKQGKVKILDRSLTSNSVLLGIKEDLHLSPEEVHLLREGRSDITDLDASKCDVFQLGLCGLWAATLTPCSSLYIDSADFDYIELGERLQLIQRLYSADFVQLLKVMLHPDPASRPDFQTIVSEIEMHQGVITLDIACMDHYVPIIHKSQENSMLTPSKIDQQDLQQKENIWFQQRIQSQTQQSIQHAIQIPSTLSDRKPTVPAQDLQELNERPMDTGQGNISRILVSPSLSINRKMSNHSIPSSKKISLSTRKQDNSTMINISTPIVDKNLHELFRLPTPDLPNNNKKMVTETSQVNQPVVRTQAQVNQPAAAVPTQSQPNQLYQTFLPQQIQQEQLRYQPSTQFINVNRNYMPPQQTLMPIYRELPIGQVQSSNMQSQLMMQPNSFKYNTDIDTKINQVLMRSNQALQQFSSQERPPIESVKRNPTPGNGTNTTPKRAQWFEQQNQNPVNDDYISSIIKQAQVEIERSKKVSQQIKL